MCPVKSIYVPRRNIVVNVLKNLQNLITNEFRFICFSIHFEKNILREINLKALKK